MLKVTQWEKTGGCSENQSREKVNGDGGGDGDDNRGDDDG